MTAMSTERSGPDAASRAGRPWWRDAVIYEIYLRSFADGNGDGNGDLAGATACLPYLADLGVDAVWIAPWFPSPLADGGYDVTDYCDIHPMFGTLQDAERLIATAHAQGIRVIIDMVANHTSEQHPWFRAALASLPGSRARDRYIFRRGRGQHGELPPNNWISAFGGSAWTRVTEPDGTPGEWYLHLFAPEQRRRMSWTSSTSQCGLSNPGMRQVDEMHCAFTFPFLCARRRRRRRSRAPVGAVDHGLGDEQGVSIPIVLAITGSRDEPPSASVQGLLAFVAVVAQVAAGWLFSSVGVVDPSHPRRAVRRLEGLRRRAAEARLVADRLVDMPDMKVADRRVALGELSVWMSVVQEEVVEAMEDWYEAMPHAIEAAAAEAEGIEDGD